MNEIPLNLYIALGAVAIILMVTSFLIHDSIQAIIYSFLSMALSYILAMMSLNGSVVMIQTTGEEYSYIPIISTTLSYFWTFIALLMAAFMLIYIAIELDMRLNGTDGEEYGE